MLDIFNDVIALCKVESFKVTLAFSPFTSIFSFARKITFKVEAPIVTLPLISRAGLLSNGVNWALNSTSENVPFGILILPRMSVSLKRSIVLFTFDLNSTSEPAFFASNFIMETEAIADIQLIVIPSVLLVAVDNLFTTTG